MPVSSMNDTSKRLNKSATTYHRLTFSFMVFGNKYSLVFRIYEDSPVKAVNGVLINKFTAR
jgi:hypothetical protein